MHFQQIYLLVPKYHSFCWCQHFLQKITVFCPKNYLYSKQQYESCVRDFLVPFSVFVRQKVSFTEKITFADSVSGIRPPDCSRMAKNPENENYVKIFQHNAIVKSFWRCFVSLVNFSHWSKIHVNIITGSGIRIAFFYKGLTRNPDVGKTPVWIWTNIWRLGRVTKFGTNVSNRMLLNAAKFQTYSLYRFLVIKRKPTGA